MSLTQYIANVVQSANNLTGEVAGKMAEIDQRVSQAVNDVPGKIRSEMSVTYYVNYQSGSDSKDGKSIANAKKTIASAVEAAPSGAFVKVALVAGHEHFIEREIFCNNKIVMIEALGYDYNDASTYIPVTSKPFLRSDNRAGAYGFQIGIGGLVFVRGVEINTAMVDAAYDGKPFEGYTGSFFKTNTSKGTVILEHVEANIYHAPLMHQHTSGSLGVSDLLMRNVDVVKQDLSGMPVTAGRQFLMDTWGNNPLPFSLYGVEMLRVGATSWSELINQDMTNALSNLV